MLIQDHLGIWSMIKTIMGGKDMQVCKDMRILFNKEKLLFHKMTYIFLNMRGTTNLESNQGLILLLMATSTSRLFVFVFV